MLDLHFHQLKKILCLGSHADDIEIGCGGTMLKLLEANDGIEVLWVILSADQQRTNEAVLSAESFLSDACEKRVIVKDFRDSFFPYDGGQIKEYFQSLSREYTPDVIFTHRREDLHQDHRLVAELTWNAFRDHLIFEYEIPKYEGDLGHPNVYVPLEESCCTRKVETLLDMFESQKSKPWFSADTFWANLRLRGLECNARSKLAEGLYCRKMIL